MWKRISNAQQQLRQADIMEEGEYRRDVLVVGRLAGRGRERGRERGRIREKRRTRKIGK